MMEEQILTVADNTELYVHIWRAVEPKAAILLAHGMTEHSARYDLFGRYLQEQGISLYCHDQRGHGKTAEHGGQTGHLRKDVDWNLMANDLFAVKTKLIDEDVTCPVYLMGHSMGSFLVRRAVQLRPNMFDGLILSGTGDGQGVIGKLAVKIADLACVVSGQETYSPKIQSLMFGNYNKQIPDARTEYDWLTRDDSEVQRYMDDPYCGYVCTNGFYHELLMGIQLANNPEYVARMNKYMPVYVFSGDKDPVGIYGKGIQNVQKLLVGADMQDVTVKLYPEGRHEMLNEINRDEVMADLAEWVNRHAAM